MAFIPGNSGVPSSFPDGFLVSDGTVTAPTFRFQDSTTGFYRPAINAFALSSNGTQTWLVSAAGAVTIGPSAGGVNHVFYGNLHRFNQNGSLTAPSGVYADTTTQSDVRLLLANQLNATQVNGFRLRTSTDGSNNTALVFEGANTASTTIGGLSFSEFLRVSHLGAVTMGPSSSTNVQIANGAGFSIRSSSVSNGGYIEGQQNGTAQWFVGKHPYNSFPSTTFGIGSVSASVDVTFGSGNIIAGGISTAGAWTLGPSNNAGGLRIQGQLAQATTVDSSTASPRNALAVTTSVIEFTGAAAITINGIDPDQGGIGAGGKTITIVNRTGNTLTLAQNGAASSVNYRIESPTYALPNLQAISLVYSPTASRWYILR